MTHASARRSADVSDRARLLDAHGREIDFHADRGASKAVHGGQGTIRQGIILQLVVRFELAPGLHLYGRPVPEGMIPTTVSVRGPEGLVFGEARYPATGRLRLTRLDIELPVWSGGFDVVVPFHPDGRVASEARPLDRDSVELEVEVRCQACDDEACLRPKTETLRLTASLEVIDVPKLAMHVGHGQREGNYDATPHLRRMLLRSLRRSPAGFRRFMARHLGLELAARRRRRARRRDA